MRSLFLTLAVLAAATFTAQAHAGSNMSLPGQTARTIVATWNCQTKLGVERTRARSPWRHHSRGFRTAELNRWKIRLAECRRALHAHDDVYRRLRAGLSGSPMADSEAALERAGRRWGVSPYFIAAIAATESSLGAAACSGNPRNAFGLASCGGSWSVPYFPTWSSAYEFMAKFLTSRWPHARTTYDYKGYAANSQAWGAKTELHMRRLFGAGPSVRYGA